MDQTLVIIRLAFIILLPQCMHMIISCCCYSSDTSGDLLLLSLIGQTSARDFESTVPNYIRGADVATAGQLLEAAEAAADEKSPLSYIYYVHTCPRAYDIIREHVQAFILQDPSNAAGILRLFFLDCFLQGCDASVLLSQRHARDDDYEEEEEEGDENAESRSSSSSSSSRSKLRSGQPDAPHVSEQISSSNSVKYSLRRSAFHIIDGIKESLEAVCPGIVSCADVLALAARDAIFMVGGPWIPMASGRRDSSGSHAAHLLASIPLPTQGFQTLKHLFQNKGLDVRDLVALSGGHTIGQTHCHVVAESAKHDPNPFSADLSPAFAANVSRICKLAAHPEASGRARHGMTIHLDGISPDAFDNAYFKNVVAKRAIFHSDASLLEDAEASSYVHLFASSQAEFFKQFSLSFSKLSQLGVLTSPAINQSLKGTVTAQPVNNGEIRMRCTIPN